jgi:hypothetical protein
MSLNPEELVKALASVPAIENLASQIFEFVKNPEPAKGSLASQVHVQLAVDGHHPLGVALQYPQTLLINSADHLLLVGKTRKAFPQTNPVTPLPMVGFLSLARVAIENSATALWVVTDQSINGLEQRAVQAQLEELDEYERYLRFRHPTECEDILQGTESHHTNSVWTEMFEDLSLRRKKLSEFATAHGYRLSKPPTLVSSDPNQKGMLEQIFGKSLEILYSQLSGTTHGYTWGFGLNTKREEIILDQKDGISKLVNHSADPAFQDMVLAVSTNLLERAFYSYKSLFSPPTPTGPLLR